LLLEAIACAAACCAWARAFLRSVQVMNEATES
jgi:hypothetical protein